MNIKEFQEVVELLDAHRVDYVDHTDYSDNRESVNYRIKVQEDLTQVGALRGYYELEELVTLGNNIAMTLKYSQTSPDVLRWWPTMSRVLEDEEKHVTYVLGPKTRKPAVIESFY